MAGRLHPAERLARLIESAAMVLAAVALVIVTAAMIAQVVFRYGLARPLQWSEIVAVYALVWVVFLGAGALAFRDGHVAISSLTDLLPAPLRAVIAVLGRVAMLAFAVVVVWIAVGWIATGRHQMSPALGLSTRWIKLAVPIGAGLMGVAGLLRLWIDLEALIRRDWAHFPPQGRPDP